MAEQVCAIAVTAGQAIMRVYRDTNREVRFKADSTPLTRADLAAHQIIEEGLTAAFPEVPLLSEESEPIPWQQRKKWKRFWLVDPLDGTKEFIRRNGEFTVNIALIDSGTPLLGVVFAPAIGSLYWGFESQAFCRKENGQVRAIRAIQQFNQTCRLKVVASRSHRSQDLEHFLASLPLHECIAMGSSLKFCLVAEGKAHLYPRLGPTMEWDTAAADAIVRAAGGAVTKLDGGVLVYNKPDLRNPNFLVSSGTFKLFF